MANKIGAKGELVAENFLKSKNLSIVARNYHSRYGEIDVIARDEKYIIFIEVKTRKYGSLTLPREAVNQPKQVKILKTSLEFLKENHSNLQPRFDVIEIFYEEKDNQRTVRHINHIVNAFDFEEDPFEAF